MKVVSDHRTAMKTNVVESGTMKIWGGVGEGSYFRINPT